jgi:hypothetical protein
MRTRLKGVDILLVLLLILLALPYGASAVESVGQVVALRGMVRATDATGATRRLGIKSPLYLDDTVKTGKRARLQILFTDNSIISLGNNTVAKIAEYGWDSDKDKAKLETEVKEGVFRVMGGLISKEKPEKFKTKTPAATIGIRGSMYAGKVGKAGLTVMLEGGRGVNLVNATGTVPITSPGFGSRIAGWNAPISPPKKFSAKAIRSLHEGMGAYGAPQPGAKKPRRPDGRVILPVAPPVSGGPGKPSAGAPGEAAGTEAAAADLAPEVAEKLEQITESVKENPESAIGVLRAVAADGDIPLDQALVAILLGMQNVDRLIFDSLINEALDLGLTLEQTKDIAARIREQGGVCQ